MSSKTKLVDVWDIIELNKRTLPEGLIHWHYSSYYTCYRLYHFSDFINHSKVTGIDIVKSLLSCYMAGRYTLAERELKYGVSDPLLDYDKAFFDGLWGIFCTSYLGTTDKIKPYTPPPREYLQSIHIKGQALLDFIIVKLNNLAGALAIEGANINSFPELIEEINKFTAPNFKDEVLKSFDVHNRFLYFAFALMKMGYVGANFGTGRNDLLINCGVEILDLYFAVAEKKLDKRYYHRSLYNGQNSEHYTDFIGLGLVYKS